ncbi:hypothetical protein [Streptomyces sp. NPDC051569]|uniref:hypothetical protein n=1 Tax=Streptomyces sp. NPDC051569 TaxID=3365661 RepID=UPI0037925F78
MASTDDFAPPPGSCRKPPGALYVRSGEESALLATAFRHACAGPSSPNGRLTVAVAQISRHPSERPHTTPPRSWPRCSAGNHRSSAVPFRLTWTDEGQLAARTDPGGGTERWTYDGIRHRAGRRPTHRHRDCRRGRPPPGPLPEHPHPRGLIKPAPSADPRPTLMDPQSAWSTPRFLSRFRGRRRSDTGRREQIYRGHRVGAGAEEVMESFTQPDGNREWHRCSTRVGDNVDVLRRPAGERSTWGYVRVSRCPPGRKRAGQGNAVAGSPWVRSTVRLLWRSFPGE